MHVTVLNHHMHIDLEIATGHVVTVLNHHMHIDLEKAMGRVNACDGS
jgi:hypothetical protein